MWINYNYHLSLYFILKEISSLNILSRKIDIERNETKFLNNILSDLSNVYEYSIQNSVDLSKTEWTSCLSVVEGDNTDKISLKY